MKKLITLLVLLVTIESFAQTEREIANYYNEICLKTEFGGPQKTTVKFKKDVNICVVGEENKELVVELHRIVDELNYLIESIEINIVDSPADCNVLLYLGSQEGFMEYTNNESQKQFLDDNWGAFFFYRTQDGTGIRFSEVFINTIDTRTLKQQKHLLREELTQTLGFPNDSYEYENSIFQQRWTEVTEYSELDKKIIKMHYKL